MESTDCTHLDYSYIYAIVVSSYSFYICIIKNPLFILVLFPSEVGLLPFQEMMYFGCLLRGFHVLLLKVYNIYSF